MCRLTGLRQSSRHLAIHSCRWQPRIIREYSKGKINEALHVSVSVNSTVVNVAPQSTVMSACLAAGVDIPRFCYHERLAIAGNCRMCLVQINGGPKLAASCAMPVAPDMKIETETEKVKKAREGVMEFLLMNHPLDCPICDQGGECDLQDQSMAFGSDRSRFSLHVDSDKRAVEDKDLGPLVATSMNRCIQCTRCVRFANEVMGAEELGTVGRGSAMEIGTFIEKTMDSNLSGNLIDLCPVGALTNKPYSFSARPWELRRKDSIDVMNSMLSSIRIDSRGQTVMRIVPRINEQINEEWLDDRSRFACDALGIQRLINPMVRDESTGKLDNISWMDALKMVSDHWKTSRSVLGVTGRFSNMESVYLLGKLADSVVIDQSCISSLPSMEKQTENLLMRRLQKILPYFKMNSTIRSLDHADHIVLVGFDPRQDLPLMHARLRRNWLSKGTTIQFVGKRPQKPLAFEYQYFGDQSQDIFKVDLTNAKRPVVLVGQSCLLESAHGSVVLDQVMLLAKRHQKSLFQPSVPWTGLHFMPLDAARTGSLQLGVLPVLSKEQWTSADFVYLLNADDFHCEFDRKSQFVVYQGHHGDKGALNANLILPGAAYTEESASWMNLEGRVMKTAAAVPVPGDARANWQILRAIAEMMGRRDLLGIEQMEDVQLPVEQLSVSKLKSDCKSLLKLVSEYEAVDGKTSVSIGSGTSDYYLADCISRNSPTMASCSAAFFC